MMFNILFSSLIKSLVQINGQLSKGSINLKFIPTRSHEYLTRNNEFWESHGFLKQ